MNTVGLQILVQLARPVLALLGRNQTVQTIHHPTVPTESDLAELVSPSGEKPLFPCQVHGPEGSG